MTVATSESKTVPRPRPGAGARNDGGWSTVITPQRGWFDWRLGQLWRFRDLVVLFVWRDFIAAYKQTVLGPAWHVAQPLMTTLTLTLVFAGVVRLSTDGAPPFLFYLSGTVLWGYFSTTLTRTSTTFTANASLLSKIYFHRLTIPLSIVLSNLIALGIQLGVFAICLAYYIANGSSVHITQWALLTPLLVLVLAGYGLGLGIIVSALTTRYRDLTNLVTFGVQLFMFATPVIYPVSAIPAQYAIIARFNPLSPIIEAFRAGFLGVGTFTVDQLAVSGAGMVFLVVTGLMLFTRVERTFSDTV